ncbi:variant erythrocyte surface antigen alpha subunit, putative [Babesia ovis]|uniref:Variant erythrocyte surface antigen alpha subunit, putative n=1 Tax=Babesia ovis TaxID=5869 RepID=A0A9W5WW40_BABOV|nr:variant erythrocyte surface antigen alpha subunit, putative [Babesia ovis]
MAATKTARANIGDGSKPLTDSPTNLKEAIDWILRITNQDGLENGSSTSSSTGTNGGGGGAGPEKDKKVCICQLAEAVRDLFRNVDQQLEPWEKKLVDDIVSQIRDVGGTHHLKELIYRLGYGLSKFVRGNGSTSGDGKPNGIINQNGYESHYKKDSSLKSISNKAADLMTCAKILMGAIPLVFSGLSYLYWWSVRGSVKGDTTTGDNYLLCQFMKRCGFDTSMLQGHNGNKLHELIRDCNILGNRQTPGQGTSTNDTSGKSFAQYLDQLRQKTTSDTDKMKSQLAENALIKLNILCAGYFRSLHRPQDLHSRNPRTPRTVREILYWLTSLPYCPVYRVLIKKIKDMFRRVGSGKDGSITFYSGNNKSCTISDENCTTFLLAGALAAPLVLLSIQDTIESLVPKVGGGKGDSTRIDIHDMYANYLFKFSYPVTETQSYYLLQDCLVALYFQLYFLKQQCNWNRSDGFDWTRCKYGNGVDCDGCPSWICQVGDRTAHTGTGKDKCGKSGENKPSPLQAFLCDCLPGFTCSKVKGFLDGNGKGKLNNISGYLSCYPPFTEHLGHPTVPGTECPVPMGFTGCFKGSTPALGAGGSGSAGSAVGGKGGAAAGSPMDGLSLNAILDAYANDDLRDSCLYQITRCICSLTRRVPRSTGTLYGFFYGLGAMLYKGDGGGQGQQSGSGVSNDNAKKFLDTLKQELSCCPGYRNPDCLMIAVYDWRGQTHEEKNAKNGNSYNNGYHGNGTLDSLHNCETPSATCGKYLHPLTGSLYNSVATQYCDTYLSWILYLSGRLQDGLKALLKEFNCIDCNRLNYAISSTRLELPLDYTLECTG